MPPVWRLLLLSAALLAAPCDGLPGACANAGRVLCGSKAFAQPLHVLRGGDGNAPDRPSVQQQADTSAGTSRWEQFNGCPPTEDSGEAFHRAVNTLAAERRIEKSQVQYISTSGSTYTVLWDVHAWESHISIYRYVRHICNWHLSTTARMVAPVAVTMTLWATLICVAKPLAQERLGIKLTMPMAPLTLVSSALALLLTLRTNQSLTRLLEARLAWGKLVLHARVLAGFLATRVYPINPGLALLAGRLLCYVAWSSRASLVPRGKDEPENSIRADIPALEVLLPPAEAQWVRQQRKPCLAALDRLGHLLRAVSADSRYGSRPLAQEPHRIMLDMLVEIDTDVGICERILSSPVPPTYTRFTSRFLISWLACVPLALGDLGLSAPTIILGTLLTSYIMIGIDEIAIEIEEPMRLLPLTQLCNVLMQDVAARLVPSPPMPPIPTSLSNAAQASSSDSE